jgi:outer membrane receptor protein involved in Fe transport
MNSPLSHNNNRNNSIIWVIPVLFLLMVMSSKNLFALDNLKNVKDSTRKTFPEVKVYANKISDNKLIEFSSNSIITKSEIEKLTTLQLSEVLSYLPGMYIKDYGGLGGLKTISLRGTLANQTTLMLNGVRLNSNQNGISDLGNLPISMIENIEVNRSGMSSQYGSGAIGGAVNLTLKNNQKDGYSLGASLGSFNENLLTISAKKNYFGINFGTSIEYKHSDGTYPIVLKHFGEESKSIRNNNSMTNISATILSDYQTDNFLVNLLILASTSKRGVPGAVLKGHIESGFSRLDEQSILIALNSEKSFSNDLLFKAGINTKTNNMDFANDFIFANNGDFLNSNFYSTDYNFNFIHQLTKT